MAKERKSAGRPRVFAEGSRKDYLLRLPADLHRELRLYSVERGESLNDVLVEVIAAWWRRRAGQIGRRR